LDAIVIIVDEMQSSVLKVILSSVEFELEPEDVVDDWHEQVREVLQLELEGEE
jgi:hypothetical protein